MREARKTTVPFPVAVDLSDSGFMDTNTPVARCRRRATCFASRVESFRDFGMDFFRACMAISLLQNSKDAVDCNNEFAKGNIACRRLAPAAFSLA